MLHPSPFAPANVQHGGQDGHFAGDAGRGEGGGAARLNIATGRGGAGGDGYAVILEW